MRYITKKQAREIWYTFRHNVGVLKDTRTLSALEKMLKRRYLLSGFPQEILLGNRYGDKLILEIDNDHFKYHIGWYGEDHVRYPNHPNPKYPLCMKRVFNKSHKVKSREMCDLKKSHIEDINKRLQHIKFKYSHKLYMEEYTKYLDGSWVLEF